MTAQFNWEKAGHVLGVLGTVIGIGVSLYEVFKARKKAEEEAGEPAIQTADGTIRPLGEVLTDHEVRIQKLERRGKKRA